jgi:hypothetical protein
VGARAEADPSKKRADRHSISFNLSTPAGMRRSRLKKSTLCGRVTTSRDLDEYQRRTPLAQLRTPSACFRDGGVGPDHRLPGLSPEVCVE